MTRIVVGVDPAVTSGDDADETGIMVVGKGPHLPDTCQIERCRGHAYVFADYSMGNATPDVWAKRAVEGYDDFSADRVVAEGNQGGELVEQVLRTVRPGLPITRVHAKHGKRTRAEPVAALYEQGRCHHVGPAVQFVQLEEQLTTWTPDSGESPDRLDALVWAVTELGLVGSSDGWLTAWEQEINARPEHPEPESLRGLPKLSSDTAGFPCKCAKPRWQRWPDGLKCVHCGGEQPT